MGAAYIQLLMQNVEARAEVIATRLEATASVLGIQAPGDHIPGELAPQADTTNTVNSETHKPMTGALEGRVPARFDRPPMCPSTSATSTPA